ncbi:NAD-dependent malic enzyme [Vibrio sp. HN007]|uniref:NAD-dependent malic enzyme n=1 Tax=Vibrio iocasae TaxID=3098914 RepID=UPI0035D3E8AA
MNNSQKPLYIPYAGASLLESPLLNKGSAFTTRERTLFNLDGLLPEAIETIDEQTERAYQQYKCFESDMDKHVYLRNIQDTNETLFYRLIQTHISEMMPIIYTPTVGAACENFSKIYRRARGVIISYPNRHRMEEMLNNASRHNVKVIVVTDGERILGLGDQGIGGMGIPIGKLSLYTSCGGISPAYTLPIVLDAGTNNPQRLSDPMYMGWRHPRITGKEYDEFVDQFIQAVKQRWPDALIQFEDFAQKNAMPILERYKDKVCCFNDDIQGTASVTVGTLLAACKVDGVKLSERNVAFVGAGSAGCGIAEAIIAQMISEGLSEAKARSKVYMVDRWGLLSKDMPNLLDFQEKLARDNEEIRKWKTENNISLFDVIKNAKPSILIGVSGVPGLITEDMVKEMQKHSPKPIIFPLSNPTSRAEATPDDLLRWTNGNAIVATGSPFEPVVHNGRKHMIPQCNNSYIFPGVGLGVIACGAKRVTNEMLMEASRELAEHSPLVQNGVGSLLPPLEQIRDVSIAIAFAVSKKAMEQGHAAVVPHDRLIEKILKNFWTADYRPYKRTAF